VVVAAVAAARTPDAQSSGAIAAVAKTTLDQIPGLVIRAKSLEHCGCRRTVLLNARGVKTL
jgi:hypothetical protein